MKILTILIFSGDRLTIEQLLDDIEKLKEFNIDVVIVEWTKNKKNLNKKTKIYKKYFITQEIGSINTVNT